MASSTAPLNPDALAACKAGLVFLEAPYRPHGRGLDSIVVGALDSDSEHLDVLGQLFGTSLEGRDLLGLTSDDVCAYGFDLGDDIEYGFEDLTACWRHLLARRIEDRRLTACCRRGHDSTNHHEQMLIRTELATVWVEGVSRPRTFRSAEAADDFVAKVAPTRRRTHVEVRPAWTLVDLREVEEDAVREEAI